MSNELRIVTAGSVDDGKSTLIGRLLYDANALLADQLAALRGATDELNLARLTDGLKAERQQGITIDVAYRYFESARRKFILADAPGHSQYTRNMVTAASNADAALVVVDARNGIVEQTRRHLYVACLLGIRSIVVCINKMDLIGFSRQRFEAIAAEISSLGRNTSVEFFFVPISALHGDNVVEASTRMPWYHGPAVLRILEELQADANRAQLPARLPVQCVVRDEKSEFRGYCGQISSGQLSVGDEVLVLPSGWKTHIASIAIGDQQLSSAKAPLSVTIELADELDVGRGDLIVQPDAAPPAAEALRATLCWFDHQPASKERNYWLRLAAADAKVRITGIESVVDLQTLKAKRVDGDRKLLTNEIAEVSLKAAKPLPFDPFAANRFTGAFVLIDELSHFTVAAGLFLPAA